MTDSAHTLPHAPENVARLPGGKWGTVVILCGGAGSRL